MLLEHRENALLRFWQRSTEPSSNRFSLIGFIATASILSIPTSVQAQADIEEILNYSDRNSSENITLVHQLKDITPSDWSYEAIRNLAKRYGCIKGFKDETYRGDRILTRYEFAAGLNSCLKAIEDSFVQLADSPYRKKIILEDGSIIDINLYSEEIIIEKDGTVSFIQDGGIYALEGQFATAGGDIVELEEKIVSLENSQFSTTTKLYGETVFGLGSILSGTKDNGETEIDRIPFFGDRINLELATSFTGEDELSIELEAANLPDLADVTDTFQGELAFSGTNENSLELDWLYRNSRGRH